ncbi:hypothetical protein [Piscinibacter sp.]|uniref:hypothetical protein n=1 Tax=Piscinibacter sp. TaxID=1903157 RepID=UPI0039E4FB78
MNLDQLEALMALAMQLQRARFAEVALREFVPRSFDSTLPPELHQRAAREAFDLADAMMAELARRQA